MHNLLTPEQARAELERKGISIAAFSRMHGLNKNLVSDLLNGRKKGCRGKSHNAAVLLGIKEGVITDLPQQYGRRKTDLASVIPK